MVNVVEGVRVTTTLDTVLVAGLVSSMLTAEPFTAVTAPEAAPN